MQKVAGLFCRTKVSFTSECGPAIADRLRFADQFATVQLISCGRKAVTKVRLLKLVTKTGKIFVLDLQVIHYVLVRGETKRLLVCLIP